MKKLSETMTISEDGTKPRKTRSWREHFDRVFGEPVVAMTYEEYEGACRDLDMEPKFTRDEWTAMQDGPKGVA
jgi:hypothetical protein